MFIFSKVTYKIPFFAHRIVMNVCELLKGECFGIAVFCIKALFKKLVYLFFLCFSFLYITVK
jgi:hypothetical protein